MKGYGIKLLLGLISLVLFFIAIVAWPACVITIAYDWAHGMMLPQAIWEGAITWMFCQLCWIPAVVCWVIGVES